MKTKNRPKGRPQKPPGAVPAGPAPGDQSAAGTYVYDEVLGKVVKVSDRIPGVSANGRGGQAADAGPCGRTECGGGTCAKTGESFD